MKKSQLLHLTPTLTTQDTMRPGRPEDQIPRGVCPNASVAFQRREAGVRENVEKKSEVYSTGKDHKAERPSMTSNQGWPSSKLALIIQIKTFFYSDSELKRNTFFFIFVLTGLNTFKTMQKHFEKLMFEVAHAFLKLL